MNEKKAKNHSEKESKNNDKEIKFKTTAMRRIVKAQINLNNNLNKLVWCIMLTMEINFPNHEILECSSLSL